MPVTMELHVGAEIDRYRVEGELGRGGMAVVYRVRHTVLGTLHALKVLSRPARSLRERLLAEAMIQSRLEHPNVVAVRDVIDVSGAPGLVMEYVRGPSLDRLLGGPLPRAWVDALVPGILAGVAAAHREGVVHRDLKPANVLIATARGRVVPKVADFGLVKVLDDDAPARTRSGAWMGTPNYMAPEQIRDARLVDARSDVFALGALLYELVSGVRAFEGESAFEVFAAVSNGRYPPLPPGGPPQWTRAIDAALRLDPAERPATVEELWREWAMDPAPLEIAAAASPVVPDLVAAAEGLGAGPDEGLSDPVPSAGSARATGATVAMSGPASRPARPWTAWIPFVGASLAGVASVSLVALFASFLLLKPWLGRLETPDTPIAGVPAPVEPQPAFDGPAEPDAPAPADPMPTTPPVTQVTAAPHIRPAPEPLSASFEVVGAGVARAWLVDVGGTEFDVGVVPPGTYTVRVLFEGAGETVLDQGSVTLAASQQVRWTCASQLHSCIPR